MFAVEIFKGFTDGEQELRAVVRLLVAAALGVVFGLERRSEGKRAGPRTHMLVALGSALFTFAGVEMTNDATRVLQGIATGIGFLGAGTIFKSDATQEVSGLTTAASIWLMAAVGACIGAGLLVAGVLATALGWLILGPIHRLESRTKRGHPPDKSS